jgi:DNA-binding MarR family transcriptional regulator
MDLRRGSAEEIIDLLREVNRALRERVMQGGAGSERPLQSYALLRAIQNEPSIAVNELARRRFMAKSQVSLMVADLVMEGLVKRSSDPEDRRLARLQLTPDGRAELKRWRSTYRAMVADEIGTLSDEDAERLLQGLRALRQAIGANGDGK